VCAQDDAPDGLYGANPPPGYESPASRRALYRERSEKRARERIAALEDEIAHLRVPPTCSFCAGLPHSEIKYDCDRKFGLKIDRDVVTCPQCNEVLADWRG
jgi:hypothetical protein